MFGFGKKDSKLEMGNWIISIQLARRLNISPKEFAELLSNLEEVDDYMAKVLLAKLAEDK